MNNTPYESAEQAALFKWAHMARGKHPELRLLFHIPNEGKRDPWTGHRLLELGLRPGVPDICLPVPRGGYHGLFIELKRRKGGTVSEDQREWIDALTRQGYRAVVCRGWDAARAEIELYLRAGQ